MADKLSRKGFLKLTGAGLLTMAFGEVAHRWSRWSETANHPVAMATRVYDNLKSAKSSGDHEKITESKKLAFIWLFAETARLFGKDAGFKKSSEAIGHYLYGEGRDLDVSSWVYEEAVDPEFMRIIVSSAYRELSGPGGVESLRLLKNQFKAGMKFNSYVVSEDIFYAIGGSTYTMRSNMEFKQSSSSSDAYFLTFSNTEINLEDFYDWNLESDTHLGEKGRHFLNIMFHKMVNKFGSYENIILNTLHDMGLSTNKIDILLENFRDQIESQYHWADKQIEILEQNASGNGYISHQDMALLETVGAKRYRIFANCYFPGTISSDLPFWW